MGSHRVAMVEAMVLEKYGGDGMVMAQSRGWWWQGCGDSRVQRKLVEVLVQAGLGLRNRGLHQWKS